MQQVSDASQDALGRGAGGGVWVSISLDYVNSVTTRPWGKGLMWLMREEGLLAEHLFHHVSGHASVRQTPCKYGNWEPQEPH